MFQTLGLRVALLLLSVCGTQDVAVDITKSTRWVNTPEIKILERSVHFKPEVDLEDGGRRCARVTIDITFRNCGEKPIRQIDLEISLYGIKTRQGGDESRVKIVNRETFKYSDLISPGETGSLLWEPSDCSFQIPVRQIIRVDHVVHGSESSLEKTR